ncbi:MAG: hypothetical protein ACREIA_14050 [Opitutaceae bacterium]
MRFPARRAVLEFVTAVLGAGWLIGFPLSGAAQTGSANPREPVTLVMDASDFFDQIPEGNTMVGARDLEVDWVFNDTAMTLAFRSNMEAGIMIPEAGVYHLFVRSHGNEETSFKIA